MHVLAMRPSVETPRAALRQPGESVRFQGDPSATQSEAPEKKPIFTLTDKRTWWQQAKSAGLKTLGVAALAWTSLWGGGQSYSLTVGDGPLPTLHTIAATHKKQVQANTTANFFNNASEASRKEWWAALAPTREVLKGLSPEIHDWFVKMHEDKKLVFYSHNKDKGSKQDSLAYFDVFSRKMYLDTSFLVNNDGEKASIIIHEYRHSRQNAGKLLADFISLKRIATTNAEIVANKMGHHVHPGTWSYGSIIEDEAHLLEHEALKKMGLDAHLEYLADRGYHVH